MVLFAGVEPANVCLCYFRQHYICGKVVPLVRIFFSIIPFDIQHSKLEKISILVELYLL